MWLLYDTVKCRYNAVHIEVDFVPVSVVYSETTWAVGIAQLTHHEVQGGGKNPSTSGTSLFEVLPLCFRKSHYLKNC